MNWIRNLAGAVAAAALLAACGSGPQSSHAAASRPATSHSPAAASSATGAASQSPAASSPAGAAGQVPTGQLTVKQAQQAYAGITGPGNVLAGKVASAASGTAFSPFRSAALAYAKELGSEIGKLRAVHWPASVQSRISTLITTTFPSDIRCLQAVAAAGSIAASQTVSSSNKDCQVADNSTTPTSI
jgi:hypothetical protein